MMCKTAQDPLPIINLWVLEAITVHISEIKEAKVRKNPVG